MLRDEGAASVPATRVSGSSCASRPRRCRTSCRSSTARRWRGKDPTLSADELGARWVPHACVLYVGLAPGAGVRHLLQQRVKRFLRFGGGRNVAHWGGRHVWQLADVSTLRIAWQADRRPRKRVPPRRT